MSLVTCFRSDFHLIGSNHAHTLAQFGTHVALSAGLISFIPSTHSLSPIKIPPSHRPPHALELLNLKREGYYLRYGKQYKRKRRRRRRLVIVFILPRAPSQFTAQQTTMIILFEIRGRKNHLVMVNSWLECFISPPAWQQKRLPNSTAVSSSGYLRQFVIIMNIHRVNQEEGSATTTIRVFSSLLQQLRSKKVPQRETINSPVLLNEFSISARQELSSREIHFNVLSSRPNQSPSSAQRSPAIVNVIHSSWPWRCGRGRKLLIF